MAFVDGARCAEGLSQSPYFAKHDDGETNDAEAQDQAGDSALSKERKCKDDSAGRRSEAGELDCFGGDFPHRLADVERRAEESTEMILDVMRRTKLDLVAEFKSIWAGYDAFCTTRVGMSAERVLEGCKYPGRLDFAEVLERYKGIEADPEAIAAYRDGMCGFWDRRFAEEHS